MSKCLDNWGLLQALLVVVSPVAFALWCLPNTEQYFRKWWDLLLKTLLVYPIVMVVFVMCYIGAIVMSSFNIPGSDWVGELMSIIAVVAPLFLVPFAFKISGGMIGQIHEGISGLGRRATQGIQGDPKNPNSLRSRISRRFQNRRNEAGLTGTSANEVLSGILPGRRNVYTRAGRHAIGEALATRRSGARKEGGAAYLEHESIWQDNKEDSKFLMAHANRSLAAQRMQAADKKGNHAEVEQWQRAIGQADLVHRDSATQMASAQAWLASGYDLNDDGQTAYNEMARTFSDITGAGVQTDTHNNVIGFSGPNAGAAVGAMNTAQAAMGRNGQWHLAGINYGTGYDAKLGFDKSSGYTAGNAKVGTWLNGAQTYLGAHLANGITGSTDTISSQIAAGLHDGSVSTDDVVGYHAKLLQASQSPTYKNDPEIQKQIKAVESIIGDPIISSGVAGNKARIIRTGLSPDEIAAAGAGGALPGSPGV